jgi:hypothetical protein
MYLTEILFILFLFLILILYLMVVYYENLIYHIIKFINYLYFIYNTYIINNSTYIHDIYIDGIKIYKPYNMKRLVQHEDKIVNIIFYTNNKKYTVLFNKYQKFTEFPIYKKTDLNNQYSDEHIVYIELYDNDNNLIVLNDDILDKILIIIKKYSGPKGNFYKDKGYYINPESIYLLKNNLFKEIRDLNVNKFLSKIEILYSDGNQIII